LLIALRGEESAAARSLARACVGSIRRQELVSAPDTYLSRRTPEEVTPPLGRLRHRRMTDGISFRSKSGACTTCRFYLNKSESES
jgi:hypothetical protein